MEKQTANRKQTKQNETSRSKSKRRKVTKTNSYSKSEATSATRARSNGQVQIDSGLENLAMLSMMLETLQTLNSTSQENEMTIVKPGTSSRQNYYQKANTNAAKLKPDFGSNKSIKRQITQKNATNNKPKKQKNPTSGSSVIKQTGPMMPSTNPMNNLIVASMIPKIESAKIVQTTTQLATVNTPIATHKKQNEPRPCTSVVKPKPPSQSGAYPKPNLIIPSRVYTNKKETGHQKTPTNGDQLKTHDKPNETKKCNASVNSTKTKQKKQKEPNPGKTVAKTKGPIKTTPHHKDDGKIQNKMSTNKVENSHRKTPANPIRPTTHLESTAHSKSKSKQNVPHPKLTTVNATKQKQNKPTKRSIGFNKIKGRKENAAHPKPDDMKLSKTPRNKNGNIHGKTPTNTDQAQTHLASIEKVEGKANQMVPHPKLVTVNTTKELNECEADTSLYKPKPQMESAASAMGDVLMVVEKTDFDSFDTSNNAEQTEIAHPDKIVLMEEKSPIHSKAIEPTQHKQKKTPIDNAFEQQVTYLLNTGRPPTRSYLRKKKQYIPELTLTGIRDERHAIMQDRLESFVDQLVEKNVGFLVEGALIINGHYNILSFVYFVPRKKRVYINSIILRQYALRGDLVKVFVMNKPEVSPADTNAVENYLGFVVAILEKRHDRTCIGSLLPQQDPFYSTLVPQDSTIPPVCIYKQFLTTQLIGNARSEENENGEHSKEVHSTETTILYQTKIIDWDGEIPIGSNLELVDKTINQKKYISHDKVPVFEQHVNYLLNNGKQPNKNFTRKSTRKFKPELTLPCIRDDSQKIVQSKLESFVDQMVEKNVGFLVERSIRVNVHNNKESYVDGSRRKKEGVCIGSIPLRQYAFHGDLVKVFVMNKPKVDDAKGSESVKRKNRPERRDRSYGFVVAILEKRHKRRCVGTLLPRQDSNYRILVPLDAKIPRLRIYMRNLPAELNEMESTGDAAMFYLADIIEWQDDVPIGANLKPLDQAGLLMNQNECILAEHNLDATSYADHILAQLPSVPYRIPQEEIDLREDLRGDCTFTIDSASARHLDDALSCKILKNGNYEIGVHISDVTYFLREQSELDELAKLRATSIYMVDSVYRMLPEQLCDLCSLLPGQEKLTFSVFFEIFPDGTEINTRFARSVINSCAKLSYENAQIMINSAKGEGSSENVIQQIFHGYTVQSLSLILSQVHSIAVKLRQRRIEKGFLELDQSRLTFWIDTATGCPMEYDQNKLTTFDVLMVLANTSAAQAIQGALSSSALIRCPQPPSEKKIEDFVKTMAEHGYTISFANSQTVRESMDAIIAAAEHPDAATIVLNKLLAQFKNHQAPTLVYTNFTSPIRRYTDCMVHRVLAAKLGFGEESKRTLEELDELAKTCNMKRNRAKVAGDASLRFCYHQWLKTVQKHETVAAVVGYDAEHIELILLGTGISLKIMTKKISSIAKVVFNSSKPINGIRWIPADSSKSPVTLKIFSKVRVTITLDGDQISVCSIMPMVAEKISSRESYKDCHTKRKNTFLNYRILLPVVAAITVISSLVVAKKLCKFK